ncbi:MAG: ABC transporter permease, partial [Bacteroidales bacterium]|nr:ABC transporter permease [Bacteroidales bacterium]
VAPDYYRMKRLDTTVYTGKFATESGEFPLAVLGAGVEQKLHCGMAGYISNGLTVYYPNRRQRLMAANPMQGIRSDTLTPVGCFFSATEYDASYVMTSLSFMQRLTGHEGEVTSVELRVSPNVPVRKVVAAVEKLLGQDFQVLDQYQQEAEMYRVMRSEKWAIFAILSFILLIASFNMIGMMAVLVLDKKKDVGIFYAMGAGTSFIRKVFVQEGLLIAGIGTLAGMLLGFAVCWAQKTFQIVRLGSGGTPYPVEIHGTDMLAIAAVVLCITLPAMLIPVVRISDRLFKNIRHE